MAEKICYRLEAQSPFHLGERGVGIEETSVFLHSDTLFSALCITLRELGIQLEPLFDNFPRYQGGEVKKQGTAPFLLTSAFPYSGEVILFPKPFIRPVGLSDPKVPNLGKTLKKVKFVSRRIFEAFLSGRNVREWLLESDAQGSQSIRQALLRQNGSVWVTPEEVPLLREVEDYQTAQPVIWKEFSQARVTIDRVTSRSEVYAAGRLRFTPGSGLYFLVEYFDESWRPKLEQALRVLGESGIGGERSSGHGQFEVKIIEGFSFDEPAQSESNAALLLSVYWPPFEEVRSGVLDRPGYALMNRHGWIGSPEGMSLRRQPVHMLSEGSVLAGTPVGALVDVKPVLPSGTANVEHDVWRYGMAYWVRCKHDQGQEVGNGS